MNEYYILKKFIIYTYYDCIMLILLINYLVIIFLIMRTEYDVVTMNIIKMFGIKII